MDLCNTLHQGIGKIRATRHLKAEGPYFSSPIFLGTFDSDLERSDLMISLNKTN
eukprot:UN24133